MQYMCVKLQTYGGEGGYPILLNLLCILIDFFEVERVELVPIAVVELVLKLHPANRQNASKKVTMNDKKKIFLSNGVGTWDGSPGGQSFAWAQKKWVTINLLCPYCTINYCVDQIAEIVCFITSQWSLTIVILTL